MNINAPEQNSGHYIHRSTIAHQIGN